MMARDQGASRSERPADARSGQMQNIPRSSSDDARPEAEHTPLGDSSERFRMVARVINAIRPSIQADGGDVELVDITDDGVVQVRLHGACVGCPSSSMTLREGLERNIREHVPSVTEVAEVS